jgi:hypothetical protein
VPRQSRALLARRVRDRQARQLNREVDLWRHMSRSSLRVSPKRSSADAGRRRGAATQWLALFNVVFTVTPA